MEKTEEGRAGEREKMVVNGERGHNKIRENPRDRGKERASKSDRRRHGMVEESGRRKSVEARENE